MILVFGLRTSWISDFIKCPSGWLFPGLDARPGDLTRLCRVCYRVVLVRAEDSRGERNLTALELMVQIVGC